MRLHPNPRVNGFFMLSGVSFVAFAASFGPCLFDINTVDACIAVSNQWLGVLQDIGNHIIAWGFALFRAAMRQH